MNKEHEQFMRDCFALARKAAEKGNPPFGALLVNDRKILMTAENTVISDNDSTRHAEMNLVSWASRKFSQQMLSESILYTSTEPCAVCVGAIYWSGISVIVYGCPAREFEKITGGSLGLACHDLFGQGVRPIKVIGPVLEEEAIEIHKQFWQSKA